MWIVFGTKDKTTRVPNGAKVERHCGACGERTIFYEKQIESSFRLYFIDIFDFGRQRVMACGGCGACYATDELGSPGQAPKQVEASEPSTLGRDLERAARSAGTFVERATDRIEAGLTSLLPDSLRPTPAPRPKEVTTEEHPEVSDLDLDPLEERFAELERKVRVRIE